MGRRHWDTFPELVYMLGAGTRYWAAVLDDDEIAEFYIDADNGEDQVRRGPPLSGWTDQREDLADIKDLLQMVIYAVTHSADSRFQPAPRPETAVQRFKRNRVRDRLVTVESQLFPGNPQV